MRRIAAAAALGALAACGGSSSSTPGGVDAGPIGSSSSLTIVACSLGCSPDTSGAPIGCAISEVFVNQVIAVEFDKPIDPDSLSPLSFRVVSETGSTPLGEYVVDPTNPRRAQFRPLVTFGSDGFPQFGFNPSLSYKVEIPASDGPGAIGFFVTGLGGEPNGTPLSCTVTPSLAVQDLAPGAPEVAVTIEELSVGGAVYNGFDQPDGVAPAARLRFEFDDVMNPATLANAVTKQSDFIEVRLDLDGDLTDAADQIAIPGTFDLEIVQTAAEQSTTVVFTPDADLPTAGSDPLEPRRVVVVLPPTITDLGGNPLANATTFSFTTVPNPSVEEVLTATFDGSQPDLDRTRTSMLPDPLYAPIDATAPLSLGGRMLRGLGGGSGRLGSVVVPGGTELVLSTGPTIPTRFGPDLATGPVYDDQGTAEPEDDVVVAYHVQTEILDLGLYPADWSSNGVDGDGPGESVATVVDGVFEFASLTVLPGGRLRLVGDNPGRLFVRGDAEIRGLIEVAGGSADDQTSLAGTGGAGGAAGPGAGAGGRGGDRGTVVGDLLVPVDGFAHPPGTAIELDGADGGGRGGLAPAGGDDFGAGAGGASVPAVYPGPAIFDLGGFEPNDTCRSSQVGVPGGGGSYALPAGALLWSTPTPEQGIPATPAIAPPSASVVSVDLFDLDPDDGGLLVGGAGGGGGGNGIAFSRLGASPATDCVSPFGPTFLSLFWDASGAGGGGGGGAVQLQVGHVLSIDGGIAAGGGDGGGLIAGVSEEEEEGAAAPGGGGSGGAVLVQAFDLDLAPFPGVVDVSGGQGGFNYRNGSRGGDGAPGVARVETASYLAGSLPVGVAVPDPLEFGSVLGSLAPAALPDAPLPADKILALGPWEPGASGPGAVVGLETCWLLPAPGSFEAVFESDEPAGELGWDLVLELSGALGSGAGEQVSFRGDPGSLGDFTLGASLASVVGNELGGAGQPGSAVVVRFQGLRILGAADDPCAIDPGGQSSPVLPGSLTPWLGSPEELSTYWDSVLGTTGGLAAQRRPNAVRAQILIDGAHPLAEVVAAVVELRVRVTTD